MRTIALFLCIVLAFGQSVFASATTIDQLFVKSAKVDLTQNTVTLPLYSGKTPNGQQVDFIRLDSSSREYSKNFGINRANKLQNTGLKGVQRVTVGSDGAVIFPSTVNFAPVWSVIPDPVVGFPPLFVQPGSVADGLYSPLIVFENGTVVNAPHIANPSGMHDKVVFIDRTRKLVKLQLTDGFSGGKAVKYLSTDSSDEGAAALEKSTWAPVLKDVPTLGDDSTNSARASLAAFVNGQTGAANPNRQGLNSALLDGLSPLNVLAWAPNQGRYSPIWDVFPTKWSDVVVAANQNVRQTDFGTVKGLADKGKVTLSPGGFVVNCPIIAQVSTQKF